MTKLGTLPERESGQKYFPNIPMIGEALSKALIPL